MQFGGQFERRKPAPARLPLWQARFRVLLLRVISLPRLSDLRLVGVLAHSNVSGIKDHHGHVQVAQVIFGNIETNIPQYAIEY